MAVLRLLLAGIFTSLCVISVASAEVAAPVCPSRSEGGSLDCEWRELKLKIAQSESALKESRENLSRKRLYLVERDELIAETLKKIKLLQSALSKNQDNSSTSDNNSSTSDKKLKNLEEEVRLLWSASRKNNFDIHVMQSKATETEVALRGLSLRVEKLADVVSEQWIQIQHLEQALKITEIRTLEARKHVNSSSCTFLKFIDNLYENQLKKGLGELGRYFSSSSYTPQALHHLKNVFSALKKCHHELQDSIKKGMESNEATAFLANNELVFFMASAVIVFPIMAAWLWFSSALR